MKVSIITVSYNSEKTIEETLKSVANQIYENIEHVIIDGGSKDSTLNIVKQFPHVAKIISEPDEGIYDAMDKGLGHTTGDIIGILNSDDLFPTDSIIEEIVSEFKKSESIQIVYGNVKYFKNDGSKEIVRHMTCVPYYETFFEDGEVPPHESLYVKKEIYENIEGYDKSFKIAGDYDFMFRALKLEKYKSAFLDKTIVLMRMGGVSSSGLRNYLLASYEVFKVWKKNGKRYPIKLFFLRPIKKIYQLVNKNSNAR